MFFKFISGEIDDYILELVDKNDLAVDPVGPYS
jgi:hypothetical protein